MQIIFTANSYTTLEQWQEFVAGGGKYEVAVEKVPFVSTHPEPTELDLVKERLEILESKVG